VGFLKGEGRWAYFSSILWVSDCMIFASFGGKLGVEKDVFDGALDINITITLSSFFKLQYVRKFLQESLN
jgi:hypothetical protein